MSICGSIDARIGVNQWGGAVTLPKGERIGGAVTQLKKSREIWEIMSKQITDSSGDEQR